MNRLPSFIRQHIAGLRLLLIFTVITGIIYPVVMVGIAEVAFPSQANGSLVSYHGRVVGSSLLCQEFTDAKGNPLPQYFQPRPSFAIVGWGLKEVKNTWVVTGTGPNNYGCNPLYSSASNLGDNNPAQIQFVKQRQQQIAAFDHVPISQIPTDAVTGSASGLDPDITPANAAIQVDRVAAARHISPAQVKALVSQYTTGRALGILGEPVVNVLLLNRALDEKYPVYSGRVLVVEDEPALLRALQINLRARGYEVAASTAGQEALVEAARRPPDAVLLDLGLPDVDGIEVIRELRTWSAAPVIVLSGRAGSGDKIGALDAGADDYVTKPFSMEELMARLRAALRRDGHHNGITEFTIGRCLVDLATRTVVRQPEDDQEAPELVHLTRTEWRMLEILLESAGQLVPSARLLHEVWGPGAEDRAHYLRFHMARLRRKLEDDPPRPKHLLTEPGMGYRYQA